MVKLDISLWSSNERMQERIKNLGTMILSLSAVNGFFMYSQKNWILLGINCLFFITTIPLFMSYSKYKKLPPQYDTEKDNKKRV